MDENKFHLRENNWTPVSDWSKRSDNRRKRLWFGCCDFKLRFVKYVAVVTTQRSCRSIFLGLKPGAESLYVNGNKSYLMLFDTWTHIFPLSLNIINLLASRKASINHLYLLLSCMFHSLCIRVFSYCRVLSALFDYTASYDMESSEQRVGRKWSWHNWSNIL